MSYNWDKLYRKLNRDKNEKPDEVKYMIIAIRDILLGDSKKEIKIAKHLQHILDSQKDTADVLQAKLDRLKRRKHKNL